jgi:hypothetical protein
MPLHGSLTRSFARYRGTSIAAAALWIAAAASSFHAAVRAELATGSSLQWPAVAGLIVGIAVVAAIASGRLAPRLRERVPAALVLLSAPSLVLIAGSGGLRSPALALAGFLLMGITAKRGYRAGATAPASRRPTSGWVARPTWWRR